MNEKQKKFLLVSRVGRKSLHHSWLAGSEPRSYDVFLSVYDETQIQPEGDNLLVEHRPGAKVSGYDGFLKEHEGFLEGYEYVAMFDEDLKSSVASLNEMFSICSEYKLKIAQPSLSQDSFFSYAALISQPNLKLRFVPFVEMMCPVFNLETLKKIAPLFSLGYESGIDLIWCNLVYEDDHDFAVIDATSVVHMEPIGGNKSANGFGGDRKYEDDIYSILNDFRIPWLACVPYKAISTEGTVIESKASLIYSALSTLLAIPKRPGLRQRLRSTLVHLNQLARRTARNVPTEFKSVRKSEC